MPLTYRLTPLLLSGFVSSSALGSGCGPQIDLPSLDSGEDDTTTTQGPPDDGTTTQTEPDPDTDPVPEPDLPDVDPPAGQCPVDSGDLELLWDTNEPLAVQGEAVAVGAGMVAWAATDYDGTTLRVLDPDGSPLWDETVPLSIGWAELSMKDIAITPDGVVTIAGMSQGNGSTDAAFHSYHPDGSVVGSHVPGTETFDDWAGLALLDGDLVAVGQSQDMIHVRRYTTDAQPQWSQLFAGPGSLWGSDVAVSPSGQVLVSGHTNATPGPVLVAYDDDGNEQWSYFDDDGSQLDVATSVTVDGQGRVWMAVIEEIGDGRVDRFDPGGTLEQTVSLDFAPHDIAVTADDTLVVVGALLVEDGVVMEHRDDQWDLLARRDQPGRRAMAVAVDEQCHTYVAGFDNGPDGAWLEKLR